MLAAVGIHPCIQPSKLWDSYKLFYASLQLNEFKEILRNQQELVMSSKEAARELLTRLGILTPGGKLKKSFKPTPCVSR